MQKNCFEKFQFFRGVALIKKIFFGPNFFARVSYQVKLRLVVVFFYIYFFIYLFFFIIIFGAHEKPSIYGKKKSKRCPRIMKFWLQA